MLLWVGDHGENLLDDSRGMLLHGSYEGSHYEYHVPLMVWYSDSYAQEYPHLVAQLKANKSRRNTTMTVFHTLIELGGVPLKSFDAQLSLSNEQFKHLDTIVGLDANLRLKPIYTERSDVIPEDF